MSTSFFFTNVRSNKRCSGRYRKEFELMILCLLFITVHSYPRRRCIGKAANIMLLMDSSSSIWIVDYRKQLKFAQALVDNFDIGPSDTQVRMGAITFSNRAHLEFSLDKYTNSTSLKTALGSIPYRSGETNTAEALQLLKKEITPKLKIYKTPFMAIVITDGRSRDTIATSRQAAQLHKLGVHVYAIGVGYNCDINELKSIVNDPIKNVRLVDSYSALQGIAKSFGVKTCQDITTTSPSPPPTTTVTTKATTTTRAPTTTTRPSTTTTTTRPSTTTTRAPTTTTRAPTTTTRATTTRAPTTTTRAPTTTTRAPTTTIKTSAPTTTFIPTTTNEVATTTEITTSSEIDISTASETTIDSETTTDAFKTTNLEENAEHETITTTEAEVTTEYETTTEIERTTEIDRTTTPFSEKIIRENEGTTDSNKITIVRTDSSTAPVLLSTPLLKSGSENSAEIQKDESSSIVFGYDLLTMGAYRANMITQFINAIITYAGYDKFAVLSFTHCPESFNVPVTPIKSSKIHGFSQNVKVPVPDLSDLIRKIREKYQREPNKVGRQAAVLFLDPSVTAVTPDVVEETKKLKDVGFTVFIVTVAWKEWPMPEVITNMSSEPHKGHILKAPTYSRLLYKARYMPFQFKKLRIKHGKRL